MARLTLQETMDRLLLLIRAGYPVIYIVSHEEARVLDYLAKIYRVIKADSPNKHFMPWYEGTGFREVLNLEPEAAPEGRLDWLKIQGMPPQPSTRDSARNAKDALHAIAVARQEGHTTLSDCLAVFYDIHRDLQSNPLDGIRPDLVRPLRNAADKLRQYYADMRTDTGRPYKTVVVVAPSAAGLSPELERDLIQIDFPLPEADELLLTLDRMLKPRQEGVLPLLTFADPAPEEEVTALVGGDVPEEKRQEEYKSRLSQLIAGAGRGLTLEDYKLGLNMFAVRKEPLCARHVEDMLHLKAKAIKSDALQYTPHVEIELGGLEKVKAWVELRRAAASSAEVRERYNLPPPRGALICGASGGGKSQLAKLIAKEFNLALLRLDVGALFGMYVGESEERTRLALQLAEVLAPVVLWVDEIDKAFQGMGDAGDSGVSARVLGHFLTWLAEKQDSIFVVATANEYEDLLKRFPEFGRKGRFDEIFFVFLPDQAARQKIFEIYLRPHLEGRVSDAEVQQIVDEYNIFDSPVGDSAFEQLCWVLGHSRLSPNLTGAEIEYAVSEALYRVYENDQKRVKPDTLTPGLVAETVRVLADRAQYHEDSDAYKELDDRRIDAEQRGWLFAD